MVRPERTRCLFLRHLDIAGRLEQAVQASRSGRGLSQEQVQAVKRAHVPNPIRLENGLAPGYRQRVKGADGALGILLEIIKVWCIKPVLNRVEDAEVKFQWFLNLVEDTPNAAGGYVARCFFHFPVAQQENVELGTNEFHR